MRRVLLTFLLAAAVAAGAAVDGKWKIEAPASSTPRTNKKGGIAKKPDVTLDLRSSGGQLTGSVLTAAGKRSRPMQITDGKIEGDTISFTTVQKSKKSEAKWTWRGTVKGDEITGTRSRDGARRGQPFTAKRQG